MFLFKLVGGGHDQDGKRYKRGDIIETEIDLFAKFGKKFQLMHDDSLTDTGTKLLEPEITKPKTTESDDDRMTSDGPVVSDSDVTDDGDIDEETTSVHGENVTDDFEDASDADVSVFVDNKKWYTIVEDETSKVLNPKKLRKKNVAPFIDTLFEDDDDDDDEE